MEAQCRRWEADWWKTLQGLPLAQRVNAQIGLQGLLSALPTVVVETKEEEDWVKANHPRVFVCRRPIG